MVASPDIVSCNVAGAGWFGGGIVGNIGGHDLAGTLSCLVDVEGSTLSGVVGGLLTAAEGPLGYLLTKLVGGGLLHSMNGINDAVQAGDFTVAKQSPAPQAPQPFEFADELGNILRTLEGADGRPQLEVVQVGGLTSRFDWNGRVLSSVLPSAPQRADGSERQLIEVGTFNGLRLESPRPADPTTGINAENNRVVFTVDYSLSIAPSQWNVNTAGGNAATAGYIASDAGQEEAAKSAGAAQLELARRCSK
jgi:hypothetical protein